MLGSETTISCDTFTSPKCGMIDKRATKKRKKNVWSNGFYLHLINKQESERMGIKCNLVFWTLQVIDIFIEVIIFGLIWILGH